MSPAFVLATSALLVAMLHAGPCLAKNPTFVHWNKQSPVFRIDNTDHIVDVEEYDQVNLICPSSKPGARYPEKHVIYSVSREEYQSCRITNPKPKIVAICNQPHKLMYFTITFRSFTPTPGGLEFHPGHDYYFISTSSRDDLHRRVGGGCSTHNMKMIFKVHQKPSEDILEPLSNYLPLADSPKLTVRSTTTATTTSTTTTTTMRPFGSFNPVNPFGFGIAKIPANRRRHSDDFFRYRPADIIGRWNDAFDIVSDELLEAEDNAIDTDADDYEYQDDDYSNALRLTSSSSAAAASLSLSSLAFLLATLFFGSSAHSRC